MPLCQTNPTQPDLLAWAEKRKARPSPKLPEETENSEDAPKKQQGPYRHGHSPRNGKKSRTYYAWTDMKKRCSNPKNKWYHRYGGRGIKVCERWHDFVNFLQDMGECPPDLTLERKDRDSDYEPSNCKWATRREQAENTSQNVNVLCMGEMMPIMKAARISGQKAYNLYGFIRHNPGFTGDVTTLKFRANKTNPISR